MAGGKMVTLAENMCTPQSSLLVSGSRQEAAAGPDSIGRLLAQITSKTLS